MSISHNPKLPASYDFYKSNTYHNNNGYLLREHKYRFKTRLNKTYIVDLEEYSFNVYTVKFYLKSHRFSKNRYNLLSGDYDGFRVISTIIGILLYVLDMDKYASFGFVGMPLIDESNTSNTKRFRVYQRIAKKYFSPDNFDHASNISNSSYLLLNKKVPYTDLKNKIEEMFNSIYVDSIPVKQSI